MTAHVCALCRLVIPRFRGLVWRQDMLVAEHFRFHVEAGHVRGETRWTRNEDGALVQEGRT